MCVKERERERERKFLVLGRYIVVVQQLPSKHTALGLILRT
jgi:hypothetical protein